MLSGRDGRDRQGGAMCLSCAWLVGEGSCGLTFLAYRGNLLEMECFVDKHKVTMLAGDFSALY